jgi:hypothetical protein
VQESIILNVLYWNKCFVNECKADLPNFVCPTDCCPGFLTKLCMYSKATNPYRYKLLVFTVPAVQNNLYKWWSYSVRVFPTSCLLGKKYLLVEVIKALYWFQTDTLGYWGTVYVYSSVCDRGLWSMLDTKYCTSDMEIHTKYNYFSQSHQFYC